MQAENQAEQNVVIVLGMHRSGTSCLAGSLQQAGLYLGDVNEAAPHNAKGNRENFDIMDLHDEILSDNGGSWDAPPQTVMWKAQHIETRDAIIETYPAERIWGFKDPRTLVTLDGWIDRLPDAKFVGSFRHPLSVYDSLRKRNEISKEKALDLWMSYNRLLLRYQERLGFEIVSFDWAPAEYERALLKVVQTLGLPGPAQGFSFFESRLRTNVTPQHETLPPAVAELYKDLQKASVLGRRADEEVSVNA